MSYLPVNWGTMPWIIKSPFSTLDIICHGAKLPQESRSIVKTTKLELPEPYNGLCHPQCYNAGSIDYVVIDMDQSCDLVDWASQYGLSMTIYDRYISHFDGVQRVVKQFVSTKSRSKTEKNLERIRKEMEGEEEEERTGKRQWIRKKSYRPVQIFRPRKNRVRYTTWTGFLRSKITPAERRLRRLRLRWITLVYDLENLLYPDLEDDES